jgi:hypothetical protein
MRYEIAVDDESQDDPPQTGKQWTAALYAVDDHGHSGDQIEASSAATPAEAVSGLLRALQRNPWVHGQTWTSRA